MKYVTVMQVREKLQLIMMRSLWYSYVPMWDCWSRSP